MKKILAVFVATLSFSAFAEPQFNNLTTKEVKDVSQEFGANFSHTAVAAPETNGLWGVEVGLVGGTTKSPEFSDVVDRSGGDGGDFKNIFHAGLMARAHFPFEIFVEATYLPEQDISDVKIKSSSLGLGWNLGGFFNLPLDVAIGANVGNGEVKFHQDADVSTSTPAANIDLETKTTSYWVGVSKTFVFVTPYLKVGTSTIDGDLDASAEIFDVSGKQKESVSTSGSYAAIGANFQFFFMRLGLEATQMQSIQRLSGKLSFAF